MQDKATFTKPSDAASVNAYMERLKHPLADVAGALRRIILETDSEVGEEIKWNAPAFFYTGELPPFNAKEYKRHIVVFNFLKRDCIRLIFPSGARVNDASALLQGNYSDGRRLALFYGMSDVKERSSTLQSVIYNWLVTLDGRRLN